MRLLGIGAVYAWRYSFGLLTPAGTCKYHPSCSQYAIDAFRAHGLLKGGVLACWRLARCNPWSHGGVDYVEQQTLFRTPRQGSPT
ncbi:MAG TPA: membrane protein insertion efficiency factor YidD [Gaiellaceae bacterium]